MDRRTLGTQGLEVSAEGLGCMGMSEFYGTADEAEARATIHRALELGIDLLDTADQYGIGDNERLVGEAIADRRDAVVIATKFGIVRDPENPASRSINGRPDYVHRRLRRVAAAPVDRPHRPVLPAPRRSRRPDRGDGRGDGRARRRRQGAFPRPLRGGRGDDPPRARGAPDLGGAERVLAVEPRHRGGGPTGAHRARDRARRLQPARPRLPHRPDHEHSTASRQTTSGASNPRFQGANLEAQPRARAQGRGDRAGEGVHPRAARARLGARAGRRRRPDPGDQATDLPATRTPRRPRSSSPPRTWRRSTRPLRSAPPPGIATPT